MKKLIIPILVVSFFVMVVGCGTNQKTASGKSNVIFKKDDYKGIISANNQLGFDLLAKVKANKEGNVFISPTSLSMALSMVYNGADGITKEEMAQVLHKEGIEVNQLNKANASLMSVLQSRSKHNQLKIANSIWLNDQFHFQDDFAKNVRDYYHAKIQEMVVTSSKTPKLINDWVKKTTNEKIEKLVEDDDIDQDTVALLINATYFKGDWTHEFNKALTEKRTFYFEDGTTKDVPLMTLNEELPYMENEDFQAVSLPYVDGKMSMKVFLPKEDSNLEEFRTILNKDNWGKWNSQWREQECMVTLPKFKLEYETELKNALKQLGMTSAFDERAKFTKMIKENDSQLISKVKQKTFLEVTEKGTEAAASTSVEMEKLLITDSFHMVINRPFFIAITDDQTGAILFMGTVTNPGE
ncbi:serpin family protein [Neobacillus sp. LXY-1]|uniref:serpin family protein n=1 Tax=Neobacillus sp. LXY-1 TaxID=3379133 RepID=UPI003EE1E190